MKKLLFSLLTIIVATQVSYAQCSTATASTTLDVNNVKATLDVGGVLWREGGHIYPNLGIPDIEVTSMYSGGIWLGGIDNDGNTRVSASTYQNSFSAGPIVNGSIDAQTCENFNRFWEVNRSDVLSHKADFADNGQIDNTVPNSILGWPGYGNPHSEAINGFPLPDMALAPFWDEDADGIYNPGNGDYPLIKGDQSIWWIYNTSSVGSGTDLNVAVMAFAASSTDEHIDNTTFYNIQVTNASDQNYTDFVMSFWMDFDLGCYTDDYFGSIPEGNLAYVYNEDALDGDVGTSCPAGINTYAEAPPVVVVKMIEGPQNGANTTADLTSIMYYNNAGLSGPPGMTDPSTESEHYNYMTGKWRDGSTMTNEGSGYNSGGSETTFAYNDAPNLEGGWSLCEVNGGAADRRLLMSTMIPEFFSGQQTSMTYAVSHITGIEVPCPSTDEIVATALLLDEACEELTVTSTKSPINTTANINFSPNPLTHSAQLTIADNQLTTNQVSIFSANGQMIKTLNLTATQQVTIDRNDMHAGMYFYKISLSDGTIATGKFIVQ